MTNDTVAELDHLAARARRDTGMDAVVLIAAGLLSCVTVALNLGSSTPGSPDSLHGDGGFWLEALAPLALVVVWLYVRWREKRRGVGRQSRAVAWTALVVAVLVVALGPFLTWVLGPYPVIMALVLLAGIRCSSRLLVAWGLVAGLLGLAVGMAQFNNRFDLPAVDLALGVAIAVATLVAGVVVAVRNRRS